MLDKDQYKNTSIFFSIVWTMKYITRLKNVLYKLLLFRVTQNYTQPTMLRNVQKIKSATVDIQQATTATELDLIHFCIYFFNFLHSSDPY